jgi:hypothetical protein
MTSEQERKVEQLISHMQKKSFGDFDLHGDPMWYKIAGSTMDQVQLRAAMVNMRLIEPIRRSNHDEDQTPVFRLTDKGWQFEGFEHARLKKKLEVQQMQSVIRTNYITNLNAGATILFGIIVAFATIITCKREANRETRELLQLKEDSLYRLKQAAHDSLYEKSLLRIYEAGLNTSTISTKAKDSSPKPNAVKK